MHFRKIDEMHCILVMHCIGQCRIAYKQPANALHLKFYPRFDAAQKALHFFAASGYFEFYFKLL
jgi:hypothetical protein